MLSEASKLAGEAGRVVTGSAHAAEKAGVEAGKAVGAVEKAAAAITLPVLGWKATLAVIAVLLTAAFLVIRSCSIDVPSIGQLAPVESLPEMLRTASTCDRDDDAAVRNCVIAAEHPLLTGGITGGRSLTFTVHTDSPAGATSVVNQWRAAGGTIVAEGDVFVAVGPSVTVRYADTRTGLRFETATFANRAGAQTFLYRAGLVR
ncbi:hypothetical protein [Nocardia nova]|uniref:hypothetical protein n=1 Tax=Nocardia nova TaxID=37330 RepID=UPI003401CC70